MEIQQEGIPFLLDSMSPSTESIWWEMINKGLLILLGITLSFVVGCNNSVQPTVQEILSQSISAMANISSCTLNIDIKNPWTYFATYESLNTTQWTETTRWQGTEITGDDKAEIAMNESFNGEALGAFTFHLYATDGKWVINESDPWVYGRNWYLNGSYYQWLPSAQYPQQINLMQTATNASLTSDATVNGVDCYTLNLVLSEEAVIDWVYSLRQPTGGISMNWWYAGDERSREIYAESYNDSSSVTVWIDKSNYRVVRINISAVFEMLPEYIYPGEIGGLIGDDDTVNYDAPCTPEVCRFYKVGSNFYSQIDFFDYNKPFSVQLPQYVPE
jgi:hypothetical protein